MKKEKFRFKMFVVAGFVAITAFITIGSFHGMKYRSVLAAEQQSETVQIRIIGTTDLHGQVNSKDYEKGVDYNTGGLARLYGLIQAAREEAGKENTITLDTGDSLYDYTTEYIFSENQYAIQPIYQAMAEMGYDAITLGNHDFDYGYDYILRQLSGSGLKNIAVVSNVTDSKTGEYPFLENMLITRTVKTSLGNEVEVNIGIIGQTIPNLSSKTHSYAGILKTEDMVQNARTQAAKLKEMGADIVIALSHTGIGPENPELNFKNVAYALTKISDIDVVVCGHEHNLFPTTDMSSAYYTLPRVDRQTYLMNGKNVIMAGDRAGAIGVVDLTLEAYDDSFSIADRKSEIRTVTAANTTENKAIASKYGEWEEPLLDYSTEVIGELAPDTILQNYYGLLGDNPSIQLLNDAKIDYAVRYTHTTGKTYIDYPVIAVSNYFNYGVDSVENYINIHDKITESDLASLQPYNNYLYLYRITGKQLREWLEWTASAYETTVFQKTWKDNTISSLMKKTNLKSLIKEEWLNDWAYFFIFDGVHYEINPGVEPRYDINGNRISNNNRIKSITYNGKAVTDSMEFIIASDKITKPTPAIAGIEKQVVLSSFVRGQSVLSKYVENKSAEGNLLPQVDYNWNVNVAPDYKFIVKMPSYADSLFRKTPWYVDYLAESNQYNYYIASYESNNKDTQSPHLVITPLITNATASPYDIVVKAYDVSEIKCVKYLSGSYDADYSGWLYAKDITNGSFRVSKNGTYSLYAEDKLGNKTIIQMKVTNFNDNLLARPTVVSYTNRKTKISGTAEPNTKIVFEAHTGTYETKVSPSGSYSYALPAQPSGSKVNIYIKNEAKKLESEHITVIVKRTGPNQPSVYPIYNNANYIIGTTNDTDANLIAIVNDTVYVSAKGGKELFENNKEIFDPEKEYDFIETKIEMYDTGYFVIEIPAQEAGNKVSVYNLDHLSRNSRVATLTVGELAPNAPYVYEISNIERSITGYVPTKEKKVYDISIKIGDKEYYSETNKNGEFTFSFEDQLYAGQVITVIASDTIDGVRRNSYPVKVTVNDIESYVISDSMDLMLDPVDATSMYVTGEYWNTGTVYLAICSGKGKNFTNTLHMIEVEEDSIIEYELEEQLEAGTTIYAMVRFSDGIILAANKTEVAPTKPTAPSLLKDVNNSDKKVQVIADKDCNVTLTVGSKTYTSSKYQYDDATNQYIYSFTVDPSIAGTEITLKAENIAGSSKIIKSKVAKAAPEVRKVNKIKAVDLVITGKLDLAKVSEKQTIVYAKIGKKTYEGSVDAEGKFTVTIPSQKAGTSINIWGSNTAGDGPLVTVKVEK